MANNYSLFCFSIENVSNAEYRWLKEMTFRLDNEEEEIPELDGFLPTGWTGWTMSTEVTEIDGDTIEEDNVTGRVYFEAEENFDSDALIALLQGFLQKFRPKQIIGFEYACTCSKMRPDEFGGGALVITADNVLSMSTAAWLYQQCCELRQEGYESAHV